MALKASGILREAKRMIEDHVEEYACDAIKCAVHDLRSSTDSLSWNSAVELAMSYFIVHKPTGPQLLDAHDPWWPPGDPARLSALEASIVAAEKAEAL